MKDLLVTLADENYVDQAKAVFSSVYFNAGWEGTYMLLACHIPEGRLVWFRDRGILVKECEPLYSDTAWAQRIVDRKFAAVHPLSVTESAKCYLFSSEFKVWRTVVMLDGDVLVKSSLDRLTKVKGFAAVNDPSHSLLDQFPREAHPEIIKQLDSRYDLRQDAFNAGIFSFSTEIIREETFSEIKNLFDTYFSFSAYGTQPVLNLYFYGHWEKLSRIYNVFPSGLGKVPAAVLHFAGPQKPWIFGNPFHEEWKSYRDRSELIQVNEFRPFSFRKKMLEKLKIFWWNLELGLRVLFKPRSRNQAKDPPL